MYGKERFSLILESPILITTKGVHIFGFIAAPNLGIASNLATWLRPGCYFTSGKKQTSKTKRKKKPRLNLNCHLLH